MSDQVINVRFDDQILLLQKFGGISEYFLRLVEKFETRNELGIRPIYSNYFAQRLRELTGFSQPEKQNNFDVDIHHATFYTMPISFLRLQDVPLVSTIHDFIPEKSRGITKFRHHLKNSYLSKSAGIISVSKATAYELNESLKYPNTVSRHRELITIPLASDLSPVRDPRKTPREFDLVFLGERRGYKNFDSLVSALEKLGQPIKLLILGGGAPSKMERQRLDSIGMLQYEIKPNFAQRSLAENLGRASIYISTSRFEGFNIGAAHACKLGLGLLLSDIPVHREFHETHAQFFNANDPNDIMTFIKQTMSKTNSGPAEFCENLERNWDSVAFETAEFYRERVWMGH